MKITVIEPLGIPEKVLRDQAKRILGEEAELCVYADRAQSSEEMIARGADADVIIVANQPFPREVVEGCKKLKLLSVAFTGVDHVAMDACRERGVLVCNCA